eukprot:EC799531.1.p1 GENE.EC799531.1~~EC799531.1.p1  ORF type:complete len:240 (+),score=43.60 EC799531.1:37-756(+)
MEASHVPTPEHIQALVRHVEQCFAELSELKQAHEALQKARQEDTHRMKLLAKAVELLDDDRTRLSRELAEERGRRETVESRPQEVESRFVGGLETAKESVETVQARLMLRERQMYEERDRIQAMISKMQVEEAAERRQIRDEMTAVRLRSEEVAEKSKLYQCRNCRLMACDFSEECRFHPGAYPAHLPLKHLTIQHWTCCKATEFSAPGCHLNPHHERWSDMRPPEESSANHSHAHDSE